MRRGFLVGLLFAGACVSDTAPSAVNSITLQSNVSAAGVFVGDQVQFTTVALDISGNPVAIDVTYTSSNTAVATISANGLITAISAGTSAITVATSLGGSSQLTLTVDGNVSGVVGIAPPGQTVLPVGGTVQYSGSVLTTLGNPARGKTLIWSTTDATKVSVSQTGLATAVATTTGVTICATASDATSSLKGCATVIVQ